MRHLLVQYTQSNSSLPIYTDSVAQMYMGKRRNEMPPHLFASSDEAYRNMMEDKEDQSMVCQNMCLVNVITHCS